MTKDEIMRLADELATTKARYWVKTAGVTDKDVLQARAALEASLTQGKPVAWIVDLDLQRLGREGRLGVILNREQSTYGLSETPLYLHPAPEAKHDAAEKKEMK